MSKLSPSEKKGLLILSGILVLGFIIQFIQPHFVQKDLYDYSIQDSLFHVLTTDTIKGVPPAQSDSVKKISTSERNKVSDKININTASQTELERLPRIGPATAKNIIKYRTKHGSFKKIEDIMNVKRIGPKTLELIKPHIKLND